MMGFPVTTMVPEGVTVATSSIEIIEADSSREYILIQNQGPSTIWVRFDGGTAVADKTGLRLLANESREQRNYLSASSVTAISDGSAEVQVTVGGSFVDPGFDNIIAGGDNVIADGDNVVAGA